MMERRQYTQADVETVCRCFPTMTNAEIAHAYGFNKQWVYLTAKRQGLRHDETTEERIKAHKRQMAMEHLRLVDFANISKARKRMFRSEYRRVMVGLPQRTKIRLCIVPNKTRMAIYRLCRFWKYLCCNEDPFTLLYDSRTIRRTGRFDERYYTQKYHIKFEETEDED